jgi:hypothetical protein
LSLFLDTNTKLATVSWLPDQNVALGVSFLNVAPQSAGLATFVDDFFLAHFAQRGFLVFFLIKIFPNKGLLLGHDSPL